MVMTPKLLARDDVGYVGFGVIRGVEQVMDRILIMWAR
jgi:hypothetical protein